MPKPTAGTRTARQAKRSTTAPTEPRPPQPADDGRSQAEAVKAFIWQAITEDLRAQIVNGDLRPGQLVPSETELATVYDTSRPTVRKAIAALRAAGLVITEHGRGTTVASRPTARLVWNPTIVHEPTTDPAAEAGNPFITWDNAPAWSILGPPQTYQTFAQHHSGLLALSPSAPVFLMQRRLQHSPTGVSILHRVYVPFAVASVLPSLGADPFRPPADLYQILSTAGYSLTWADTIGAEMPSPDDTSSHPIPEGIPILIHHRVTRSGDDAPLTLEETRLPAHQANIRARPAQ